MNPSATIRRVSVRLRRRPVGAPTDQDFDLVEEEIPALGTNEVLTRTLFLSIDPYMRGRLSDAASYATPVAIGEVMTGETVGEVVASTAAAFAVGDVVVGARGWQTHCVSQARALQTVDAGVAPASTYLGVLGMPGVTAYSGMTDIGQPRAGETVVVSAASGAVGSVAGQLAKRAGARVIGVAGGAEKCAWVRDSLRFDDCVDHRASDLPAVLARACPDGIDVYFENVGGLVQHAAFALLNPFARVVMCGMVSQYNDQTLPAGPNLGFVVRKRVHIEGLIVTDKPARFAEWRAMAGPWVRDASLIYREDIIDGLENAVRALAGQLGGGNFGKMLVRL